jgi:hypothetical protein
LHQVTFLGEARERGTENLFELFDDLDEELLEHYEKEKFRNERERKRWEERRDELRLFRETCRWLVEQGGRHRQRAVIALGKCGVARRTRRRPRRPSVAHETHRKIGAEGWPERSLPMRVGKKIQTLLLRYCGQSGLRRSQLVQSSGMAGRNCSAKIIADGFVW